MSIRFPEFRPRSLIRSAAHNQIVNTLFNGTVGESLALLVTGVSDAVNAAATFRNRNPAGGHLHVQHSSTGATVFRVTDAGVVSTGGASGFNVKAFGAVGDGGTDDGPGIDACVAACQAAGGGTVFFPPGVYHYSGAGIVNIPPAGVNRPLLLAGAGSSVTRVVFVAVSNTECIRLGSLTGPGGFLNLGQGVVDMGIEAPVDKDVIAIADVEQWRLSNLVINQCRTAIELYNTRFGRAEHLYIFNYRGAGITVNNTATGVVLEDTWFEDIEISGGVATTGWGFEMALGAAPNGNNGTFLKHVVINHSSHGGFLFSTTGASHANQLFPFMLGCVADSANFTEPPFRFKNGRFVFAVDCWAYCVLPGQAAVEFDRVAYGSWTGGNVSNGHGSVGGGGSIFDLKNGCVAMTIRPSQMIAAPGGTGVTGLNCSTGAAPIAVSFDSGYQENLGQMIAAGKLLSGFDTQHASSPVHMYTSQESQFAEFALLDEGLTKGKYFRIEPTNDVLEILNTAHSAVITTITNAGDISRRRRISRGTALVAGDIVLSSGFGTTRSVSAVAGGDDHCTFVVNAAGSGQGASPTVTVTFKDGAFSNAPVATVVKVGGNQFTTPYSWTTTPTTLVITFGGTPVAGESYTFVVMTTGR